MYKLLLKNKMKKILIIASAFIVLASCKKNDSPLAYRVNNAKGDVYLHYDHITIDLQKSSDITLLDENYYYIEVECFGECSYQVNGHTYTSTYKLK